MKTKKNLVGILAGLSMLGVTGCATVNRVTLTESNNYKGNTAEYFAKVNDVETTLDAAETNREARCLRELDQFKYKTKDEAYKELSKCVDKKRDGDIAKYMIISVLVDGVKLYGLVNGLGLIHNGGSGSGNYGSVTPPSTHHGPTIGTPTQGYTHIWKPIQ